MQRILIKPLTVNRAYRGRRFRSNEYDDFEREVGIFLKRDLIVPPGANLSVTYRFGFSSKQADIDNPIKVFQDILQKFYGFNDKMIYEIRVTKEIVKKGEEYVEFDISTVDEKEKMI